MHLLAKVQPSWDMKNLIQLQNRDRIGACGSLRFDKLLGIERFADQDVQHFAGTRLALAHDLGVVNVKLSFAVAPVAVVLEEFIGELRIRGGGQASEQGA